jgi:hypothetical protein
MPVEFKIQRSALPDTFVTVLNDAVAWQDFVITVNGTATNVVLDPRNSIYKRVQVASVDVTPFPVPGPPVSLSVGPNPARVSSRLRVQLGAATSERIEVTIYDSAGRAIRMLGPSRPGATTMDVLWDLRDRSGRRVASGLYFVRARVGPSHEERSVVVLD